MNRKECFKNYYDEYLEVCYSLSSAIGLVQLRNNLKKENNSSNIYLPFGTCLMDYSSKEYSFISEHCDKILSYSKQSYESGGFDFHAKTFHPDDRNIFYHKLFYDIKEFWKTIKTSDINKYRFSFSHRYFRKDGTISQMLQQSTYLEPNSLGVPVLNLLTFTDIGDFKTDNNLVLTVSRLINGHGYVKVFTKSYPQQQNKVLSKRESEILLLCLDGLSSKMIADKLCLSIQTVKNHKRNMQQRTSARNTAELIKFSIESNWI